MNLEQMKEEFIIKYRVAGWEGNEFVTKGEFNTQKEALNLANELNRKQNTFYYDWHTVKISKQK